MSVLIKSRWFVTAALAVLVVGFWRDGPSPRGYHTSLEEVVERNPSAAVIMDELEGAAVWDEGFKLGEPFATSGNGISTETILRDVSRNPGLCAAFKERDGFMPRDEVYDMGWEGRLLRVSLADDVPKASTDSACALDYVEVPASDYLDIRTAISASSHRDVIGPKLLEQLHAEGFTTMARVDAYSNDLDQVVFVKVFEFRLTRLPKLIHAVTGLRLGGRFEHAYTLHFQGLFGATRG